MKLRRESRGPHFYDRERGLHLLLDEYSAATPAGDWDQGPITISMALTNACDLSCEFCYAPKSHDSLNADDVLRWCKEFSRVGTLEVAFGGGEPTLYRGLSELCRAIWCETDLGISITTHGHHLRNELIDSLHGCVSVIRVSIDAPEPYYSSIRGRPLRVVLDNVRRLSERIPFGINTVVNSTTLPLLDEMAALVQHLGAVDWLLLPEVRSGKFVFTDSEWVTLDKWIAKHRFTLDLRVVAEAVAYLTGPFLFQHRLDEYAHIGADGHLRRCSYSSGGIDLERRTVEDALRDLNAGEAPSV